MADAESYELLLLRNRTWELHSRYEAAKRTESIRIAKKAAEQPDVEGVKVVKHDVDPETAKHREQTIFKLYRLERNQPGDGRDGPQPPPDTLEQRLEAIRKRRGDGVPSKPFEGSVVPAVSLAAMAAAVVAGTLFAVPTLAGRLAEWVGMAPSLLAAALALAVAVVVFGLSLSVARRRKARRRRALATAVPAGDADDHAGPQPAPLPVSEPEPSPKPVPPSEPIRPTPAPQPIVAKIPPAAPRSPAPPPKPEVRQPPAGPNPAYLEKQTVIATRFVARLLRDADPERERSDPEAALGLDLFMAGAVAALAKARALALPDQQRVLRDTLQLIGRRARQADGFIESFEAELARHAQAVETVRAGEQAMEAFLAGETTISERLQRALAAWGPGAGTPEGQASAFLFVDAAPFADLAMMRDDALVKNASAVRDRLFRAAVTRFGGAEIRQSHRGLLAAFPSVAAALDAAIRIQRDTAEHNGAHPELPVHLQAGLDSGGPAAAAAGETAAWACRKAQRDQILASESVRDHANGHGVAFRDAGMVATQDLYEAVRLFEVVWSAAAPVGDAGDQAAES